MYFCQITRILWVCAWLCFLSTRLSAQIYRFADSTSVLQNGQSLWFPFTGGFNACQFNNFDLDNDGAKDIVLFEKSSSKILPFLVKKTPEGIRYIYAPEHESFFPTCVNFLLLRDYDQDGNEDLFTYSLLGMKVYHCVRRGEHYYFSLVKDPILSDYYNTVSNILIGPNDYPCIQDMDADGDLDIVNFNYFSGSRLEFHKNMSVERYHNLDSLVFKQTDECFAGFQEVLCDTFTFGLNCQLQRRSVENARIQHVGSGALLPWDVDRDGLTDLLIGKNDCDKMNYLKKIGKEDLPSYESKIYKLRSTANDTFKLSGFPNPFAIDTDADGELELLASYGDPSSKYVFNFEASNYLFDQELRVVKNRFLQEHSIDLGEYAAPVLHDYDHDGDDDLLVGYHTHKEANKYRGGIAVFKNMVSNESPVYSLVDKDYMDLLKNQWVNVMPQFFDINNDGNIDLLVTASLPTQFLGTYTFAFHGLESEYFRFGSVTDTLSLPLNIMDVPYFMHLEGTHKSGAFVGKSSGRLDFYIQEGMAWVSKSDSIGTSSLVFPQEVVVAEANVDGDEKEDLLLCSSGKKLLYVSNYKSLSPIAWRFDTVRYYNSRDEAAYPIVLSKRHTLYSKFTKDKMSDIWVGCATGGLFLFKESNVSVQIATDQSVFPNPFISEFTVRSKYEDELRLYDLAGKVVFTGKIKEGYNIYELPFLKKGVYILNTDKQHFKLFKE